MYINQVINKKFRKGYSKKDIMQYLMGQFKENLDGPSSISESTHHKT
jgi:hypothetical protein